MCEALTIASVATTAAVTGYSIYSQKKQGDYDAQVAENNARLAAMQAGEAVRAGGVAAEGVRDEASRITGAAKVALASGNISSTVGSGAAILAHTQAMGAMDAERARANAMREAWGYGQESRDLMAQAAMRKRSGVMGGVATGLGGVASILGTLRSSS